MPLPVKTKKEPLHPDVIKLGLVSFFTDLSSEIIFSVFAVFFTTIAGASTALLGIIEGLADFSASALNYLSGWISDRSGKRKWLAIAGYGFSTLAKMILLISTSIVSLSIFRVIERLGKGFRGPPRDAWLSSVAHQDHRGYAFGVHKALDKAGAVVGPLVAYGILRWLGETPSTYSILFLVAFVPAVISIVLLARIPEQVGRTHKHESIFENWAQLSSRFKRFLIPAGIFSLAYFSLGFILLKAHEIGFKITDVVLLYALYSFTCVISAPLVGKLGDLIGRSKVVLLGYSVYAGINLLLIYVVHQWQLILIFAIYGLFYAIDESQNKAFIADLETDRRATAIGIYNFVTGILYLPASLLAGFLWTISPQWAFALAAVLSCLAIILFLIIQPAYRSCDSLK
jgi:MFS family permease